MDERRRSKRIVPARECFLRLTVSRPVRVRDISASGGLLEVVDGGPAPGSGELRMTIAGAPFAAHVEVRREEQPDGPESNVLLGTEFTAMTPQSRQLLAQVLEKASR